MPTTIKDIKNFRGGLIQACIKFDVVGAISYFPLFFIANNERFNNILP